jgi:hypothetical protein
MNDGWGGQHLRVKKRLARQQAMEGAAMPVRPIHHWRDAEFMGA